MAEKPNCFGFVTPERCPLVIDCDKETGLPKDILIQIKLDFDKKTGSTKVNEDDKLDLYKLIQSYKGQCGVEYIRQLIAKGMLNPAAVADDGQHGGDASIPTDPNDLYRASLSGKSSLSVLARELGITLDENTTDEQIAQAIVRKITPAAQQAKTEGGDK